MSQAAYNTPTSGTYSMTVYAGLMNGAWNALASKNSGASAPANGPGSAAQEFQDWCDTTNVNFPIWKMFDGVNWPRIGTLDVANSNWLPKMGGGVASLVAATTTNIGAQPQTYITITGFNVGITSLGTAAAVGEEKKLQFSGTVTLVYNAGAIVTPGLANIITKPGDSCVAVYQGSGIWFIFAYTRGLAPVGTGLQVGDTIWRGGKESSRPGFVRANGFTIGNPSSGATELASNACWELFNYLYNTYTNAQLPVSGGRGASAAADFWTNNKTIQLPDYRGLLLAGFDDMGNTARGVLTANTMVPDAKTVYALGGAEMVTLTTTTMPAHAHPGSSASSSSSDSGHAHAMTTNFSQAGGSATIVVISGGGFTGTTNSNAVITTSTSVSVAAQGSSAAHVNVQPTVVGTWWMAL